MSGPVGFDPAPLLAAVPGSQREQAEACGVTTRTIVRWRQGHTGVDRRIADDVACRLGHHPAEVWGDDWWAAS